MTIDSTSRHPFMHEKQPTRAYLVTSANAHARDHQKIDVGTALGKFLKSCPSMPKDELDWLSDHYKRVHAIHNTETTELPPV